MRFALFSLLLFAASCGRTITYRERMGCSAQRPCDDGIACTSDLCRPDGTCQSVPNDALCSGSFCVLEAHCDATMGCIGTPRDCSNALTCDVDSCDEAAKSCQHVLDNSRCPMGQICTLEGCRDCMSAADCSDGVECTADACEAGRCTHRMDVSRCDDSAACTADSCNAQGACVHTPNDALCNDGIACTDDRCAGSTGCQHTAVAARCNDNRFCTGVEICDVMRGCVSGTPPVCDDGIGCTVDRCDGPTDRCAATPNDALCPAGHFCGTNGCAVFAYAVTTTGLFDVRLPSGVATFIGPTRFGDGGRSATLNDIALDSDGGMYGMEGDDLLLVDRLTGRLTFVRTLGASSMNALDVLPGGLLYGSGGSQVFSINRSTGALTTVATLPNMMSASGDLAVVQGRIYITTVSATTASDMLVEVIVDGGPSRVIGSTGADCLWGLAAYGPLLYGFDCNGVIHRIDLTTGLATAIASGGPSYWGASSR